MAAIVHHFQSEPEYNSTTYILENPSLIAKILAKQEFSKTL